MCAHNLNREDSSIQVITDNAIHDEHRNIRVGKYFKCFTNHQSSQFISHNQISTAFRTEMVLSIFQDEHACHALPINIMEQGEL